MIADMLHEAHAAHLYYKRMGRPHKDWGNGSLMARANMAVQLSEPFVSATDYLQCLEVVIAAVLHRRRAIAGRT